MEYAYMVFYRGDILVEEIDKLALDRHILKGCDNIVAPVQSITFSDVSKLPMDIICNGFSMRESIRHVLQESCLYAPTPEDKTYEIEEITEALMEEFRVKLRLKQGTE
ncbi:hypothetical protein LRR18_16415 [Mangrovimonas sp. AS39]|uniref:hypothetical protein n=1 Tax=Mangrovimonas futianensis TaxID=2895523 RepID=UPI001E54A951|nr:hypothetical protein [Mangrovimonas futianensis]MCF1193174.1 hypothetical protein [Mangrovimonas futianensis]